MSEKEGVESQEIREAVERIDGRVAWLDVYQIYLVIALALNVIGLLRNSPRVFYALVNGIEFQSVFYFVLSLASIVLYVFALKSLRRLNKPWVYKLHLAINGAAVVSGLLWLIPMGSDAIRNLASIVGVASFSLWAILPRDPTAFAEFLQAFAPRLADYFSSADGLYQMYRVANIIALALAAVWAVYWLRYSGTLKMAMPVEAGVDATAAPGEPSPRSMPKVLTAVWLTVVTLGVGAILAALMVGLFIGALLSAANSIASFSIPLVIGGVFVASLWVLFALKKYKAAVLVSVLVPGVLMALALLAGLKEAERNSPEARAEQLMAEEQALIERAAQAQGDIEPWLELAEFHTDWGMRSLDEDGHEMDRHQAAVVEAYVQAVRMTLGSPEQAYGRFEGCGGKGAPYYYRVCLALDQLGPKVNYGEVMLEAPPELPTGLLPEMMSEEFRSMVRASNPDGFLAGLAAAALGYNDIAIRSWQNSLAVHVVVTGATTPLVIAGGRSSLSLEHGVDAVLYSERLVEQAALQASPIMFVGYGINDESVGWDDFKGFDVRGKTLLALDGKPELDPNSRQGPHSGGWDEKFREATTRGAAGLFVVRDLREGESDWSEITASANYWNLSRSFMERVNVFQERSDDYADHKHLAVQGFLTRAAAEQILSAAGKDPAELETTARSREFQPIALGLKASTKINYTVNRSDTKMQDIIKQGMLNALNWYRKAADMGNTRAQGELGVLYLGDAGVATDYQQAYYWLLLATAGDRAASNNPVEEGEDVLVASRDAARSHLSQQQRDATELAARDWTPQAQQAP